MFPTCPDIPLERSIEEKVELDCHGTKFVIWAFSVVMLDGYCEIVMFMKSLWSVNEILE